MKYAVSLPTMDKDEVTLDSQLQQILNIVQSNDVEAMLELDHPFNLSAAPSNHGNLQVEHDRFSSLQITSFPSREDLLSVVRKIGVEQGYVMVIKRSRHDKNVVIGCDRGGAYRETGIPQENRKNRSSSRLINCPFEIVGRRKPEGVWKVEIKTLSHNHVPSNDMSGHPYCRRFSEEEVEQIKQMHKAGIAPRQILSSLRQSNLHLLAVSRNIYSMTSSFKKEMLAGRSIIQALLDELGDAGFSHNIEYNEEGEMTHLFFAHPISIQLTKSYPHVFVMDCTYKTNKYKMPLLEIIGMSSFNKSFYSGFVFLQKEKVEDYVWALKMFSKLLGDNVQPLAIVTDRELALMNAIKIVFPRTPNLLCVWHIEKNILANCKSYFEEETVWVAFLSSWNNVISSCDEFTFNECWKNFEVEYKDYGWVLNYIRETWLIWKERFVDAWTGQVTHFGNNVTSRAEGAHGTLKAYLQVSTGDLHMIKDRMCLAIQNQFQEIKTQLSSEKIRVPRSLCIPFFKEVVGHVSVFALYEVHKQYVLANTKSYSSECKGHFFKTMGLPCVHMIREKRMNVLTLEDIHSQWRMDTKAFGNDHESMDDDEDLLDCLSQLKDKYKKLPMEQKEVTKRRICQILDQPLPFIFEPNVRAHKGRPIGSKKRKNSSSTTREPSLFELVGKTPRECSLCKKTGHNSRTCPSKAKPAE